MATKPISQKKFLKGLSPAPGILSQAPGTLQRVSNLLLTQRGSLQTCDGSFSIGQLGDGFTQPRAMGVFADLSVGQYAFYPVLSANVGGNLLRLFIGYPAIPPTQVAFFLASDASTIFPTTPLAPAILPPGDPQFASGSSSSTNYNPTVPGTTGSVAASITPPAPISATNSLTFLTFPSVVLVPGNGVTITVTYQSSSTFMGSSPLSPSAAGGLFYSTNGGATFIGYDGQSALTNPPPKTTVFALPPGLTNLNQLQVQVQAGVRVGGGTFTSASCSVNVTNVFATVSTVSSLSPYGGISGDACVIPQILQFALQTILILGNGLPPQTVNPTLLTAATATPLSNTFVASYPSWQTAVAWITGNQIVPTTSNGFLYQATQGGVSGATEPAFPTAIGATVVDNQVIWQNVGQVTESPAPRGAAHGIVYAGSLWLANTSPQTTMDNNDGPTVLKMSDTNNAQSWNPLNVAFIGRDDGTQITGLASFTIAEAGIAPTGSLCVFKEFSTYQIFGVFGASDFTITQAQTDMGCIAARTLQFLPGFGIARLAHLGFAIFDGVRDRLISEEIRPYIFGGIVEQADIIPIDFSFAYFAKGVQATTPPLYFCVAPLLGSNGLMNRVFCYDLVLKAWMIIDLPWPISALNSVRVGEGKPLLLAGRSDNGAISRLQSGDATWDAGTASTPINWNLRANDIFLEGSSQRAFFRQLTIRGQSLDPTLAATITVSIFIDGQPMSPTPINYFIEPQPGSNQFQLDVDILVNAQISHVRLGGTGRLLIDSIDWDAIPKKGRKVVG